MRNSRFLVVDDSKIILSAVRNIITNRIGSEHVLLAKNGIDALKLLKEHKVDMIICDAGVSKLDGLGLLKTIRDNGDLTDIPFIMMSTNGNKEAVVSAIQKGANQYLVKPFSPEKLDDVVRKAYNSAHKRAARRYSCLPKHTVNAVFNGTQIEGVSLDISRSGSLLKLPYSDDIKLFDECEITMDFDEIDELAIINVGPVPAKILRLEASQGYHSSTKMCEVALCFIGESIADEAKATVKALLKFLNDKEMAAMKA